MAISMTGRAHCPKKSGPIWDLATPLLRGRGDALVGTQMVNAAWIPTLICSPSTYPQCRAHCPGWCSLKEAFEAAVPPATAKFGDYAIYEHCLPFQCCPRPMMKHATIRQHHAIWTADRDREIVGKSLQG